MVSASVCATSSGTGTAPNSGITLSANKAAGPGVMMPMSSSGSITQGATQWKSRVLSGYATSMEFDLSWSNPSNSLRLRIYAPDGSVWGPLYDNCDGKINGFIPAILTSNTGLPQGTYYVEIYGDRVSGTQSYTLY